MLILNSYIIENSVEVNKKAYKIFHVGVSLMKMLTLFFIFLSIWIIWSLLISAFCLILALIFGNLRKKTVYTFRYIVDDDFFNLIMIDIDGNEKIVEKLSIDEIKNVEYTKEMPLGITKYCGEFTDVNSESYLRITTVDKDFFIIADKYFYSILVRNMRSK